MIALAAVLAVGAFVRLYRIQYECLWYDEVVTVQFLNDPSLRQFISDVRAHDNLKMPLYMVIEYYWWHAAGESVLSLRLLTVSISLLTIAAMFLYTRRFWGTLAALVASFAYSLSLPLTFHAQEVRMYTLLYAFCLLSCIALHAAINGARRAWYVHGVLNFLVFATHLLGPLLFVAQGTFLVLRGPRNWKRYLPWSAVHAAMIVPFIPWLMSFSSYSAGTAWMPEGELDSILLTFARDYPGTRLGKLDHSTIGVIASSILPAVMFAAIGWAIWKSSRTAESRRGITLLVCWWIIPAVTLFAISHLVKPCYVTRFVLHAAIPGYILAGIGISTMRRRLQWPLVPLVLISCVVVAADSVRPMRGDIASAVRYIDAHWRDGDTIITRQTTRRTLLAYYLGEHADRLAETEGTLKDAVRNAVAGQRTWYVSSAKGDREERWSDRVRNEMARNGIAVDSMAIRAVEPLLVFRFDPGLEAHHPTAKKRRPAMRESS